MTISECSDSVETLLIGAIPKDVRSLHYYELIVLVYVAIENGKMCIFATLSFLFGVSMDFIYSGSILATSSISSTPVILSFFPLRRKVRGTARGVGQ